MCNFAKSWSRSDISNFIRARDLCSTRVLLRARFIDIINTIYEILSEYATHNDTHRDNIYIKMHKSPLYVPNVYVRVSQIKIEINCNRVPPTNDIEFHILVVTHLSGEPDQWARFVKDGTAFSSAGIRKFSQICRRSGNRGTGVHTLHRHEATRHRQKLVSGLRGRWVNLKRGCT